MKPEDAMFYFGWWLGMTVGASIAITMIALGLVEVVLLAVTVSGVMLIFLVAWALLTD